MKKISLILILTSWLAAPALAADDAGQEELRNLRQELRQTQNQLSDLTRRIERLSRENGAEVRAPRSFTFGGAKRPMVGIVMSATGNARGVRLQGVTPDGPADKAGLESGDVILAINGEKLSGDGGVDRAYDLLAEMETGDRFEFSYERDGEPHTATVVAEVHQPSLSFGYSYELPDIRFGEDSRFGLLDKDLAIDLEQFKDYADRYRNWQLDYSDLPGGAYLWRFGFAWSGLELASLNSDLARYFGVEDGVLVIASDLDGGQLKGGDVILAIDGEAVSDPKQAMRRLSRSEAGEEIPIRVIRNGAELELTQAAPQPGNMNFELFSDDPE